LPSTIDPTDHWFEYDCHDSFTDISERIRKDFEADKPTVICLRGLLLLLYYLKKQGNNEDQVRVVEVDVNLDQGPYLTQILEWQFNGRSYPLHLVTSIKQIRDYPNIGRHWPILRAVGFPF